MNLEVFILLLATNLITFVGIAFVVRDMLMKAGIYPIFRAAMDGALIESRIAVAVVKEYEEKYLEFTKDVARYKGIEVNTKTMSEEEFKNGPKPRD